MKNQPITVTPTIFSRLYSLLMCLLVSILIDSYVTTEKIDLENKVGYLKLKNRIIIKPEEINKFKSYCDLALMAIAFYIILDTKTKKYKFDNFSVDQEEGIISRKYGSIDMTHVTDFEISKNILQRTLGVATIKIISKDKTTPELNIRGISDGEAKVIFEFLRSNSTNSMVGEMIRRRSI